MTDGYDVDTAILTVLTDRSVTPDPYPHYREIREHAPIHKAALGKMWIVSSYEEARAVLRDPRCGNPTPEMFEQGRTGIDGSKRRPRSREALSMLQLNPPDHGRIRGLVSRAFTPRRVEEMRPEIEAIADELLDTMDGHGDLVSGLAHPLPANVISAMVGVPREDREQLRPLIGDLTVGIEPTASDDEIAMADAAAVKIRDYLSVLIAARREEPREDLLSVLVHANEDGDKLTENEILVNTLLIYAAGFETTTHLIGNMFRAFVANPDQLDRVRADRSLIPAAVEEVLRYDPPVQIDGRYVHEPIEIDGKPIPAGDSVITLIGAVNRDPAHFDNPDSFDIGRTDTQVLSFGSGIHFCLGAALARLEGQVVLGKLLDRYQSWEIVGEPTWRPRITLRGVECMEVALA